MSATNVATRLSVLLFVVGISRLGHADERLPTEDENSSKLGLGLGAVEYKTPYRGVGDKVLPFPVLLYENSWMRVFGNTVGIKLPSFSDDLSLSIRAKIAIGEGYKASDSSFLEGMKKRNGSIWIGPAARWHNEWFDLSADVYGDASGESKGQQAHLSIEKPFAIGRSFELTPHVGVEWLDKKYVDYYYGVKLLSLIHI